MKVSELIDNLERIEARYGDIEVTCTGCLAEEDDNGIDGAPFETTVENLIVGEWKHGKRVRLWL